MSKTIRAASQATPLVDYPSDHCKLREKVIPDLFLQVCSFLNAFDLARMNLGGGKSFRNRQIAWLTLDRYLPQRTTINLETRYSRKELEGCGIILRLHTEEKVFQRMTRVFQRMKGVERILARKVDTIWLARCAQGFYPECVSLNVSKLTLDLSKRAQKMALPNLVKACPNLQELTAYGLDDESGSDRGFEGVAEHCRKLTSLDLSNSFIEHKELEKFLSLNPKIKRLQLGSSFKCTPVLLPYMHQFEQLTLSSDCDIDTLIRKAENLRRLEIRDGGSCAETLQLIAMHCSGLEELGVPNTHIKAAIDTLHSYTKLHTLDVSDCMLIDDDVAKIVSLAPQLQDLTLDENSELTDQSIAALVAPNLLNQVIDEMIDANHGVTFQTLGEETTINFSSPEQAKSSLRVRCTLNLTSIGLRACTKISANALRALMFSHSELHSLNIVKMPVATLLNTIPHLSQISSLWIGPRETAAASNLAVTDALTQHCSRTIEHLSLHNTLNEYTSDVSVLSQYFYVHLAKFLENMRGLKTFMITSKLTKDNITHLAEIRPDVRCFL